MFKWLKNEGNCREAWAYMMQWKMRLILTVNEAGSDRKGKHYHRLQLECGHIVCPVWNGKTFYFPFQTKSRCYKCAEKYNL